MGYETESQYERELYDMSDRVKEMAKQIRKDLAQKSLTIHDAKSVLRACEIYMECNCQVSFLSVDSSST